MFRLEFSQKVNIDIVSVLKYISEELEAPGAAEDHYNELIKTYNKLKENPFRRSFVQNKYLAAKGVRSINVKNYILFYKIKEDKNKVLLFRFLYNKRDWINILSSEIE